MTWWVCTAAWPFDNSHAGSLTLSEPYRTPRVVFPVFIISNAVGMILLRTSVMCSMILPSVHIINLQRSFPTNDTCNIMTSTAFMGQTSGLVVPQPVSPTSLLSFPKDGTPLGSFQSWQTFMSPSIQVKTVFPGVNIISCLRNWKHPARNCVPDLLMGSARYHKLSSTFGGYSSMPPDVYSP